MHVEVAFTYAWVHVEVGLFPCMLNDEVAFLHVDRNRNRLVGASYLDIEDNVQSNMIGNEQKPFTSEGNTYVNRSLQFPLSSTISF